MAASSVTAAAPARSKVEKHNVYADLVRPGKLDVNSETAKLGNFDTFSDGTRAGTADPRTDSVKLEKFDTFGDGLHTTGPEVSASSKVGNMRSSAGDALNDYEA